MERKTIDFYKVQKRKISLEENDNTNDSNNLYCMTLDSLHENKSTLKSDLESFFKSCSNFYNANKYYKQCISIMEQLECNNVELINSTSTFFAENIIPYIEHLYLVKDCIDESSLSGGIKEKILLSIKENKICDRVLGNIKSIGKRYDLNKIIDEKRNFILLSFSRSSLVIGLYLISSSSRNLFSFNTDLNPLISLSVRDVLDNKK